MKAQLSLSQVWAGVGGYKCMWVCGLMGMEMGLDMTKLLRHEIYVPGRILINLIKIPSHTRSKVEGILVIQFNCKLTKYERISVVFMLPLYD